MLSANRDSYESELVFFFRIFNFILLEDEQNVGVRVLFNLKLHHFMPFYYLKFTQNKLVD